MSDEISTKLPKWEARAQKFITHPYFSALGLLTLFFSISLILLLIQYYQLESLADSARSQVDVISNEYNRFTNNKSNYEAFIDDIASAAVKKKPAISDFENIYIQLLLSHMERIANSNIFRSKEIGVESFLIDLLNNYYEAMEIFYAYKDLPSDVAQKMIKNSLQISSPVNPFSYDPGRRNPYQAITAFPKIELMEKYFLFGGKRSEIGSKQLSETCLNILRMYNSSIRVGNDLPFQSIIRSAFEFFVIKDTSKSMNEIAQHYTFLSARNAFGKYLTETKYNNLIERISTIHKEIDINGRIRLYNENIYNTWYTSIESPGIQLRYLTSTDMVYTLEMQKHKPAVNTK